MKLMGQTKTMFVKHVHAALWDAFTAFIHSSLVRVEVVYIRLLVCL